MHSMCHARFQMQRRSGVQAPEAFANVQSHTAEFHTCVDGRPCKAVTQTDSIVVLQIQTCRQHAIAIVHSYPAIPEKARLLEVLAAQRGEPCKEILMQPAGLDSLQHSANWQQVVEYLQYVNADNLNRHVPLLVE